MHPAGVFGIFSKKIHHITTRSSGQTKLSMNIIGLDAAAQDKNIGCILGKYENGHLEVKKCWDGTQPLVEFIGAGIQASEKSIVAIDAPLGWPVSFRKVLSTHCAGRPLAIEPESFFKRQTDLDIHKRFKKMPLEISADRIARTAFFTLKRIAGIEETLGFRLPLLWSFGELSTSGIVEVYPAATLLANELSIKGYKQKNIDPRKKLLEQLKISYDFTIPNELDLTRIEHDFDALVCCLACVDFIEERACPPDAIDEKIREEGWIWVK